ncbi:MAG: chemotaxis protein CheA [Gammaproteobacteria bacterium]|nr:chemotaxis protein CheA [Gammaproteobacteria bacterium]
MSTPEETFVEESLDLLVSLESALLELEEQPDDKESVDQAFRAMHTIKGSGAMFGFDKLSAFTHHLENAFDLVRNNELEISKDLINIALKAGDHIKNLLDEVDPSPGLEVDGEILIKQLHNLFPASEVLEDSKPQPQQNTIKQEQEGPQTTYRLRLTPSLDAMVLGMDPLVILREVSALGSCHINTLEAEVPSLKDLNPENCYFIWDLVLTTTQDKNAIEDVFIFIQDDWTITIEAIDQDSYWSGVQKVKPVGEILLERGDVSAEQIEEVLSQQKRTGEMLTEIANVSPEKIKTALQEQKVLRKANKKRKAKDASSNVKVPSEKLDILMDLVGELVIAHARLNRTSDNLVDTELTSVAEEIERLTTELRDNTLGLRMLPIGTTFARFRRLVRDLSNDLDKEIELVTEGAETELDKTVIDSLGDPMVHLIRNSLDHGIEKPDDREAAGKPRTGIVHLSAVHSESHVLIKIKDDGAGLDAEAIYQKAIERGIYSEDSRPTDQELYNLIFDAGFSTAKKVTSVSGRGVGMDVVRRSIETLRGKVTIDSERGIGSTITITLPLTLAIIEGLLVKVGEERYVIPLSLVEECIEIQQSKIQHQNENQLIEVRGELVPYLRLREWFSETGEVPDIEQIVITRIGETRFGFTVDEVIGQHQTVIKALGKLYESVKGMSGATILGDGAVALILDVPKLIESLENNDVFIH